MVWAWLGRIIARGRRPPVQYVVAVMGLALTALIAWFAVNAPGVYEADAYVVMLPPSNPSSNAFFTSRSLVITAGVVSQAVPGDPDIPLPTAETVPLSSLGIKHGYSVQLPNSGTQWVYVFNRAELSVQVVGSSPDEVRSTLDRVVLKINKELAAIQSAQGTSSWEMIRTELSPHRPSISYSSGSRSRTGLVTLLLGVGLTVVAMKYSPRVQRRVRAWRQHRPEQGLIPPNQPFPQNQPWIPPVPTQSRSGSSPLPR